MTIAEIVRRYLEARCKHFAPETAEERTAILNKLSAGLGEKEISECKPYDLLQWLESQTTWTKHTTRQGRTHRILSVFNWAARVGLIESNPFNQGKGNAFLEFIGDKDADCGFPALSDLDFDKLLDACRSQRLKRAIVFLRFTGCRPVEMRRATWGQYVESQSVIVQKVHKTMKKSGGKPRTIHVTDELRDVLASIRAEQLTTDPDRHIFVNDRGRPYSRQAFNSAVRRTAKATDIPHRVTPYGLGRVAFIERGILANVNLKAIAELVGHAGTDMLDVYARRIGQYGDQLKGFASQIASAPLARRAV